MPAAPTHHFWSVVVLVGQLVGVLAISQPSASAQGTPAVVEEYPCPFEVVGDRDVRCGEIAVPLDRDVPGGATVTVPFAVYETDSEKKQPDPVVYIDGGPGDSTLAALGSNATFIFDTIIDDRDLILFDQRGTGFSEPSIRCPETFVAFTDEDVVEAMGDCGERLAAEGTDVSKFATDDVVLDLEDLRRSLGYEPWNLYGISYGTTVALASARDVPDGVRTITLDSTYPQGRNTDQLVANAANAFSVLAAGCEAQKGCRKNHADVADGFVDLIADLNESPAMVPVYDSRNQRQLVPVTGTELAGFVFQLMYSADALNWLPRLIGETAEGDYTMIANALGVIADQGPLPSPDVFDPAAFVEARFLATECNERYSFLSRADMEAANEPYPEIWPAFYNTIEDDRTFSICEVFGSGAAPEAENDQVFSDVPTVVLAGSYDPVTPPSWGRYAASGLSVSTFYELATSSHAVAPETSCGATIVAEFLDDPTGTAFGDGCESVEGSVRFQNSRAAGRVEIRNLTVESNGFVIRTKSPRNWTYVGDGLTIRDNGPLDSSTGFLTYPLEANNRAQAVREVRSGFASRGTKFRSRGVRATNAGEWEVFAGEFRGQAFDFAIIDVDGDWFVQLLISELDERQRLRRVVLNQSLKRFKVESDGSAADGSQSSLAIPVPQETILSVLGGSSEFADLWEDVRDASGQVVNRRLGFQVAN